MAAGRALSEGNPAAPEVSARREETGAELVGQPEAGGGSEDAASSSKRNRIAISRRLMRIERARVTAGPARDHQDEGDLPGTLVLDEGSVDGARGDRQKRRRTRGSSPGGAVETEEDEEAGALPPALLADEAGGRGHTALVPAEEDGGDSQSGRSKVVALTRATRLRARGKSLAHPDPDGSPLMVPSGDSPRLVTGPVPHAKGGGRWIAVSALLAIALPVLIASLYYLFLASDQYMAEGRFSIRTGDPVTPTSETTGIMAAVGLTGSTPIITDSFIVADYLQSRQLIEELQRRIDLGKLYSRPEADFWARFNPNSPIEKLVDYWKSMNTVYFDTATGIIHLEVKAFTAADAQLIAATALDAAEGVVNDISRRARDDTVQTAKDELSRAELRLKFARKAMRDFRDREKQIDPTALTAARMTVVSGLESQLATQQAERAQVNSFLSPDAPSVKMMDNRIEALKKRLEEERQKLGTTGNTNGKEVMSSVVAEYEELETDVEFAEQLYKSALTSAEAARLAASQKVRYVASYVQPRLPEYAAYPSRFKNIIIVLAFSVMGWLIGLLVFYGIRDHTI